MKKILVPIDGSKYSDLAMAKAKQLANAFGSSVVLLHVNDFHQHMFNYNMELEEQFLGRFDQIANEILEEGARYFSDFGDRVEIVKLEGNVSSKIIEYANSNDFDLVVMGSHGRGAIQNMLMGGVANKVVHHVKVSVLIVK